MTMGQTAWAEFEYRPLPMAVHLRGGGARFRVSGLEGDFIFETIRKTACFYERELLETVSRLLSAPPAAVLDIGANIGNHTLFWAKAIGASVTAVEASPAIADVLQANVRENGLSAKVRVVRCAAGSRAGSVYLQEADGWNLGKTSVSFDASAGQGEVAMKPVDDILDESGLPPPALVKIDVEGFEFEVLQGARRLLSTSAPDLVVELQTEEALERAKAFLEPFGYRYYVPLPAGTPSFLITRAEPRLKWRVANRIWHVANRVLSGVRTAR